MSACGTLAVQSGPLTGSRPTGSITLSPKPIKIRTARETEPTGHISAGSFAAPPRITPRRAMQRYSPDLTKDPYLRPSDKYYYVPSIVAARDPDVLYGGWTMVLVGRIFEIVFGWHFTWLVNSATHLWGSRRFERATIRAITCPIAALTFGEGWHNNHHAYPRSATPRPDLVRDRPNWYPGPLPRNDRCW